MRFTKMQGIGNDYIYVDAFVQSIDNPSALARKMSDRHFGVGADGLILLLPSEKANVRMRMFNADGSEAEMCGNGIRCLAKFAFENGRSTANPMTIETGRGVLTLALNVDNGKVNQVTVNMGPPILDLPKIPVDTEFLQRTTNPLEFDLTTPTNELFRFTFVSMGNPHAICYVDDPAAIDLSRVGPMIENHKAFPRRINVHFVRIQSPTELTMRTWERGSGITLACGTGACAVAVAGVLTGRNDRTVLAHLPGGDLNLEWRHSDNAVYMTGPATEVFTGEWNG